MIAGIFHQGSGLGNQLHRYVATRVLALEKGYEFSMVAPENFKGSSFIKIDTGTKADIQYWTQMPAGKVVTLYSKPSDPYKMWEEKTNYYNPEFNFIHDETILDGEFQDERYFGNYLPIIDEWLKVESLKMPDDLCIINFRGGEFKYFPDLFLTEEYWDTAIKEMHKLNPNLRYEVHTDDVVAAKEMFPNIDCIHDMGLNWRSIRYAKYLILSNSSFAILPALLSPAVKIIAPRYWGRRNTKEWQMPQNYYRRFTYI